MKAPIFAVLISAMGIAIAQDARSDTYLTPTLPGTSLRDWSQPGYRIDSYGRGYQTIPGTGIRDWSQPGFKIQGDTVYPTTPGTSLRDWSQPGWRIDSSGSDFGGSLFR